jgi:ankyrin repeat protein
LSREWDERLLDAAQRGDLEDAENALDMGASAAAHDDERRSALWLGLEDARYRELRAMQWTRLLKGADPEMCPEDGATPLINACTKGWSSVVRELVQMGADAARVHRGEEAVNALFKSGLDDEELAELLELLLEAGADPSASGGPRGRTPLHAAIARSREACVRRLLAAGADPNALDDDGDTPFSLAAARWRGDLCEALVRAGARASDDELRRAQFLDRCRREAWADAAPLAADIVAAFPEDAELAVPASQSLVFTGDVSRGAELALGAIGRTFSDRLLARVMMATAQTGSREEIIDVWHRYKDRLDPEKVDPHVIANAIAGYGALGDFTGAVEELEPWWTANTAGGDKGMLAFNVACVYAQVGRLDDGLQSALKARRAGYTVERLEADEDMAPLVAHPAWALLVRGRTRDGVALRSGEDLVELYIDGLTVTEARGDARERTAHEDDRAAAMAYSERLRALESLGYARAEPPGVEDWVEVLVRALAGVRARQAVGELGTVGALIVEWDWGDGDEEELWIAAFDYDDVEEASQRFSAYTYSDGALTEDTDAAPALFSESAYAAAVSRAVERGALDGLSRRSPFFVVVQEHDAGIEYSARLD